ncbi:DUF1768-domain-containing protein [Rickenella mellea]|uniref:DUF1768-domain-containing protein n=1 Tax=Rickenella mellea TaxID=50990 RepID=A0A4R5XI86_9AGAM|nr:DUF1768-domain-containing protein [Rickenella mellea]
MTQNTGFTHVSPHKILYKKKLYPTALHLLEAMKFLGRRNDLAERVRLTERVPDLLALTEELEGQVRRDWPDIMESKMEEVLYMKFRQHPDLRQLLMETNDAELIYDEEGDSFWGVGVQGQGANRLGQALHNVRERLRREGAGRSFGLGRG